MTNDRRRFLLAAFLVASAWPIATPAITLGQVDTFQDGTTQSWVDALGGATSPVPPTVVANAGPEGAGDFALLLRSTGSVAGAGGKLVVNNATPRWQGDYAYTGVDGLMLDVRNVGTTDLNLRVGVDGPAVGTTGGRWVSDAVFVPAASGWQTLTFSLLPGDLLPGDFAATSAATTLRDVAVLRILHAPVAGWSGNAVTAQLRVDNIEVLPEPGAGLALAGGGLLLRTLGPRRRR
jgi:hypothetical protein